MKPIWQGLAFIICLSLSPLAAASGDDLILDARTAIQKGDRDTLERLAAISGSHVLTPYVHYWLLINKLARTDPPPTKELEKFLQTQSGSMLAERLRGAWIQRKIRDKDWEGAQELYAQLLTPDREQQCQNWFARMQTKDRLVLADVSSQWKKLANAPESCNPVLRATVNQKLIDDDGLWWRFREQMQFRKPAPARTTLGWFSPSADPGADVFKRIVNNPAAYIDRLPANFATTRKDRELAMAALIRLMRSDTDGAKRRLTRIQDRLKSEERAYVWINLAYQAALSHAPQTLDWYRAAGNAEMTPSQRAWRIRAALRENRWKSVRDYIEELPEEERKTPQWQYWLARAHAATGNAVEAAALYEQLAGQIDYYGMLAAEELGRKIVLPQNDIVVSQEYARQAAEDPGLKRAVALFKLDMRVEGEREWNWSLRNKPDGFILAAAQLALKNDIYDRAINTAERIRDQGHFELRFLTPYRPLLEPHIQNQNLDPGWVYGVIRQESRFVVPARSVAGAQGLMQVMPATGKWVAKKIGMTDYKPGNLAEPETNVYLGTQYMRMVLDELDNHPVLASAGYNAGPGRARRWRASAPMEGALYVETIPIRETQDYVKKVMTNTVIYTAMLEGKPTSLKALLGTIVPPPKQTKVQ